MRGHDTMRAERYRELAVAERDQKKSALLNRLAEEAERGVLCTVHRPDHVRLRLAHSTDTDSRRLFIDVGDCRFGFF